jgi:hypothetical protein
MLINTSGLLAAADITSVSLAETHVHWALVGWRRFGKGQHRAALNFGDCFSDRLRPTEPRAVWCTTPNVHASRPSRASSSPSPSASRPLPPSQANATLQKRRTAITDALASDQNNLGRRLASERHRRLIQLPAGPGRHRATAAKGKGRRSAAR